MITARCEVCGTIEIVGDNRIAFKHENLTITKFPKNKGDWDQHEDGYHKVLLVRE